MRTVGFFIAFLGWLMSAGGYSGEHIAMIVIGLLMVAGSYYFAK